MSPTDSTPDGHYYAPADPTSITGCWIQSTQFPNLVSYAADSTKSPYLNDFIIMACAAINAMCSRKFNYQLQDYLFMNSGLFYRDYKTFVVPNKPLDYTNGVWLQVVNTWATVDPVYFQLIRDSNAIKILPTFQTYVQTTLPLYALNPATNLWIRYYAGYKVDYSSGHSVNEVPMPVRMATAMYVDYLYSRFTLTGGVTSYKTQTYSQTSAVGDDDPILASIKIMLKPFIEMHVV